MSEEKNDLASISKAHHYSKKAGEALAANDYAGAVTAHEKAAAHFLRAASMTSDLGSIGALRALAVDHDGKAKDIKTFTEVSVARSSNNLGAKSAPASVADPGVWEAANRDRWIGGDKARPTTAPQDQRKSAGGGGASGFTKLGATREVKQGIKDIHSMLSSTLRALQAASVPPQNSTSSSIVGPAGGSSGQAGAVAQSAVFDPAAGVAESYLVVRPTGGADSSITLPARKAGVIRALSHRVDDWDVSEPVKAEVKKMQATLTELEADYNSVARENQALRASVNEATALRINASKALEATNERLAALFRAASRGSMTASTMASSIIASAQEGSGSTSDSGGAGAAAARIAQLEERVAELNKHNSLLSTANRRYEENWERLKMSAAKKRSSVAAGAGLPEGSEQKQKE